MDLNVIYPIAKDLCWQHVKSFVSPESISMILYRACLDPYITKKTIRQAISRLNQNGFFCVECEPENITFVISLANEIGYDYKTIYSISESNIKLYVVLYKNIISKFKCSELVRINIDEDLVYELINKTDYQDTVLFLGDYAARFSPIAKQMGRYAVVFTDDLFIINIISKSGLRKAKI